MISFDPKVITASVAAGTPRARHARHLVPPAFLHGRGLVKLAAPHGADRRRRRQINILLPVHGIAKTADASPPGLVGTPRAPGPPGALRDGQVVPPKGKDGANGAHEEAEEDVEAVVAKVEPARGGDEDGGEEGRCGEDEEVQRGCGGLAAGGGEGGVVGCEEVRC